MGEVGWCYQRILLVDSMGEVGWCYQRILLVDSMGEGCTESLNITHHCPSNGKETQNNQIEKENGRPKITVIAQPTE